MKDHISKLAQISRKKTRLILGLMSGTSLDGLDLALCSISGAGSKSKVKLERFRTIGYDDDFKSEIRKVFAKREVDFQHLTLLNVLVAEKHANLINRCLAEWGIKSDEVDLIASHGQTVFHAPRVFHGLEHYPNATLQIGDGDHIALRTGIITLSDFRQKHVAAGGEGAPLALYGDYFLFAKPGEDRFLLNIGGIANFTYLPGDGNVTNAMATDTGPGNTLLDAFSQRLFGVPFDEDGRIAAKGQVQESLLQKLKAEPFFAKAFPKTIGPELFSVEWVENALLSIPKGNNNPYDILATLSRLSAETIAEAILRVETSCNKKTLYLSGGGAHNPAITKHLKNLLPGYKLHPMKKLGIDGDAKEALLFAVLANEAIAGQCIPGAELGGISLVSMGKISLPG